MLGMIAGMWTGCFQDLAGLFKKETKAHGDCKEARTLSLRQSVSIDQKEVHCQNRQCAVCVRALEVPIYLSVFLVWGSEEGRVRLLGVPFWRFSILEDRH